MIQFIEEPKESPVPRADGAGALRQRRAVSALRSVALIASSQSAISRRTGPAWRGREAGSNVTRMRIERAYRSVPLPASHRQGW
ncbi:hypothetical protein K8I85_18080, partial [bacterium]|nr:hypothetical protein [bacterium]